MAQAMAGITTPRTCSPTCELEPVDWAAMWREDVERTAPARWRASGIPARYDGIGIDDTAFRGRSDGIWDALGTGVGMYIIGPVGVGKTAAAAAVARDAVARGWSVRFASAVEFYAELRGSYDDGTSEARIMSRYTDARLVVLDDLGKGKPTAWAVEKLFALVDGRYRAGLPLIVTTQYDEAALERLLTVDGDAETAQAIVSRVSGMTRRVRLSGDDRRAVRC